MWDALDGDVRQIVLDAARSPPKTVALCRQPDTMHTAPKGVFVVDGFWKADRSAFACTIDLDRLPTLHTALAKVHSRIPSREHIDRIHLASDGSLIMFNHYPGWAVIGRVERRSHGKYGAFHGVQRGTSTSIETNCVLLASTATTRLLSMEELREHELRARRKHLELELQVRRYMEELGWW